MPTHDENLKTWGQDYEWTKAGDEWSEAWGGADAQWFGCLLPRVHNFLPAKTILEIAPGHGRWTNYLRKHCDLLIGIDMAPECIKTCEKRFVKDSNLKFYVNNGKTLPMVPDQSVDFVFSFDSLVHAEADSLKSYLHELKRVLKPNGSAFLHHSNLGNFEKTFKFTGSLPKKVSERLISNGVLDQRHWRAFSVKAEAFQKWCNDADLNCVGQELINWGGKRLIDCISWISPRNSNQKKTAVLRNPCFMLEAERCRLLSSFKIKS